MKHTRSGLRISRGCGPALAAAAWVALSAVAAEIAGPPLPPDVRRAMLTIRGEEIVARARILTAQEFHGRETGSKHVRKAAESIVEEFRQAGLMPGAAAGSYLQAFKIRPGYTLTSALRVFIAGDSLGDFSRATDYMPLALPGGKTSIVGECALAGYGITAPGMAFDEYNGLDVRGRVVLVFAGVPWGRKTHAWLVQGGETAYEGLDYKATNAAAHGAICLLAVDNPVGWRKQVAVVERLRTPDFAVATKSPIPIVHVTRQFAAVLTGMTQDELRAAAMEIGLSRAPQSVILRGRRLSLEAETSGRPRMGRNVIGILPGGDEKLRKEAVVVGAHYDHLGEGASGIYFGANDNAAGVGAMMAIARAFTRLAKVPRRTIVFIAFDAEEIGRMGSKHYVAHPAVPLDKTVLMVNFDMIGRNDANEINAVGTRTSPELHLLHQEANRHVGLTLVHPLSLRLGRSDHSPFYFADVPILYLFGGLHADYNTPQDTWDKLIPGKVERVAHLAFLTARAVAEREQRITFQRQEDLRVLPTGRNEPRP